MCYVPSLLHTDQAGGLVGCETQVRSHLHTAAQGLAPDVKEASI